MKIAYDADGVIRLNGESLPTEWNGIALTVVSLTADQKTAYQQATRTGVGAIFSNGGFSSIAAPAPSPIESIENVERSNPFTHRSLREFFIGFGEVNEAFKATLLYQRAKAVDDAIKLERAKL